MIIISKTTTDKLSQYTETYSFVHGNYVQVLWNSPNIPPHIAVTHVIHTKSITTKYDSNNCISTKTLLYEMHHINYYATTLLLNTAGALNIKVDNKQFFPGKIFSWLFVNCLSVPC